MSNITQSLRSDLAALLEGGVTGKVAMQEFAAICLPPVRAFGAADVRRLRELFASDGRACCWAMPDLRQLRRYL